MRGFDDKIERSLTTLPDERNAYAHSNFRTAAAGKAQAYIEKLIDIYDDKPLTT